MALSDAQEKIGAAETLFVCLSEHVPYEDTQDMRASQPSVLDLL